MGEVWAAIGDSFTAGIGGWLALDNGQKEWMWIAPDTIKPTRPR